MLVEINSKSMIVGLRFLVVITALATLSGCALVEGTHHVGYLARRTTAEEPRDFPYERDEKRAKRRNRRMAERAWSQFVASEPGTGYSEDYRRGFIDGFKDFLFWGGTGEPSLVPPRDYWRSEEQNTRGRQAISEWYAGFRTGSQVCRSKGYREKVIVPSSMLTAVESDFNQVPTSFEQIPAPYEQDSASHKQDPVSYEQQVPVSFEQVSMPKSLQTAPPLPPIVSSFDAKDAARTEQFYADNAGEDDNNTQASLQAN